MYFDIRRMESKADSGKTTNCHKMLCPAPYIFILILAIFKDKSIIFLRKLETDYNK